MLPITLKISIDTGTPHDNACCLAFEWGGTDKMDPVWKLLPACLATLVCRVRIVEPTYSDAQRAQLNLYTREDHIANGSLSLKLKNEPILKLVTKIMWKLHSNYFVSPLFCRYFMSNYNFTLYWWWDRIPKRLKNMILICVLIFNFLMKLRFKHVTDVPGCVHWNYNIFVC